MREVVAALEALYSGDASSHDEWSRGVVKPLARLIDEGCGVGFSLYDRHRGELTFVCFDGVEEETAFAERMRAAFRIFPTELFGALYAPPRPVVLLSEVATPAPGAPMVFEALHERQCVDAAGMASEPERGYGLAAYAMLRNRASRLLRNRHLRTIALHLEAATRVRLRPDAVVGYVTSAGRVEIAPMYEAAHREVHEAATRIERVRRKGERDDGEHALAVWSALVAGELSLRERIDNDGKRLYDLIANAPDRVPLRGLTSRESAVVHAAARGLGGKETAFSLGLSTSAASIALRSAATKLGLPSVRSLVRVAAILGGAELHRIDLLARLTPAEREVVVLTAEGLTNREIAARRASCASTIANQLASIRRKTGLSSRHALIGLRPGRS